MLELVIYACLLSSPVPCDDESWDKVEHYQLTPVEQSLVTGEHGNRSVYGTLSQNCDAVSMPTLQKFTTDFPGYKVVKWTCGPSKGTPA